MKKSGYRTSFHIYLIFFLTLIGTILAAFVICLLLVTVQKPDGEHIRSSRPKSFAEHFGDQIIFMDGSPQIKQAGMELLRENHAGLQILDSAGYEIYAFDRPDHVRAHYSYTELLELCRTGHFDTDERTSFVETVTRNGREYAYIVHYPVNIRQVTMLLNGEIFTGGKTIILLVTGIILLVIISAGILYGFWTAQAIGRLTDSICDISKRCYLPMERKGAFGDLYDSLNALDREIKESDQLREKTDTMRKEWIANITHDLKTPLAPIKGYAELIQSDTVQSSEQRRKYAGVIQKNAVRMETLIDDLKLTYQLENGMLPIEQRERNLVRFLKELVIDILNRPEYETRHIQFISAEDTITFPFDEKLFTRAFQNLIINAFVHGEEETEIGIEISVSDYKILIRVIDNGKGMTAEEAECVFERYYRGTSTGNKPEGTGLGLAIAKNIIELHNGTVSVYSIPGLGTTFELVFPQVKIN